MIGRIKNRRGFSLVETIVASAILSATVLVIIAASTMAISTTQTNRNYEKAASLIEKQFSLIDFIGIDDFIDGGILEGEAAESEPVFHWAVETEYQEIDSLYQVRMTVTWVDRKRVYSLAVDTMLNGETVYVEGEEEEEADSGGGSTGGGSEMSSGGGSR